MKFAGIAFVILYCLTWIRIVPETQGLLTKMDENCIGKAFKEKADYPNGVVLFLPHLSQERKVSYKIGNNVAREYINNIDTTVIPIFPLVSYYSYHVESSGFECGGSGITHIGLDNELKITKMFSQWIT